MNIYVFGEAHLEYSLLMKRVLLDYDNVMPELERKADSTELVLLEGLIERLRMPEIVKNYVDTINVFPERIKEFYKPVNDLLVNSSLNCLFIEGNYDDNHTVLNSHLSNRGINYSLFSKVVSLDKGIVIPEERESCWRGLIINESLREGMNIVKVGRQHVSRLGFNSSVTQYLMDTSFMSREFMLDCALIKELMCK